MRRRCLTAVALTALAVGVFVLSVIPSAAVPARADDTNAKEDPKVAAARAKVELLDDLVKGFVVHITGTYVSARELTPAAIVTRKVFEHMEKKGHGKARLLDATGKPFNAANRPKTAFEKRAVEQIKAGKAYVEEVDQAKKVLRAATVVPAVMKSCIVCHDALKEGQVMGAIVYEVPLK